MTSLQILPVLAYGLAIASVVATTLSAGTSRRGLWVVPAIAATAFWVYSIITVLQEGLVQFWFNHTTTFSGNQVWFDLLLAVAICFFMIAPRARAANMRLWLWAVATIALAGLALLPMLARLLYLEDRAQG